jgi:hypothetical protein
MPTVPVQKQSLRFGKMSSTAQDIGENAAWAYSFKQKRMRGQTQNPFEE